MRAALLSLLLAVPAVAQTDVGGLAYDPHPGAQLPLETPMRDEGGRPTTLAALLDRRPAIVALDYLRCPNVCGVTLAGLAQATAEAKVTPAQATVLVVSIDPRETAAEAHAAHADYARRYPATASWRFATAPPANVRRIADRLGFNYRWEPRLGQYVHSVGVAVVAGDGRVSSYLLGLDPPAAAVRRAVDQARAGEIAARPSLIRLICFGGDVPPGRTGDILVAVRALSAALLLGGAAWIVVAFCRERA